MNVNERNEIPSSHIFLNGGRAVGFKINLLLLLLLICF